SPAPVGLFLFVSRVRSQFSGARLIAGCAVVPILGLPNTPGIPPKEVEDHTMKRTLIAFALASLLPLAAQADDKLSYTYVEGNYLSSDSDAGLDAEGFGLRGSYEFGQSGFYGTAGYSQSDLDGTSIDAETVDVGFGYAHSIS